jgi:hypothetical protein
MIDIKKLNIKEKVELLKQLYKDISSKGIKGDTELAHINEFEKKLLIMHGGSGTINPETGLRQYFGGGGGGGGSQPDTTTQYVREAPGIEERKLGLMDIASSLAKTPLNLPAIQVQGLSGLRTTRINCFRNNWCRSTYCGTRYCFYSRCSTNSGVGSYFYTISKLF